MEEPPINQEHQDERKSHSRICFVSRGLFRHERSRSLTAAEPYLSLSPIRNTEQFELKNISYASKSLAQLALLIAGWAFWSPGKARANLYALPEIASS
jgi:hypothetical protein